MNETYTDTITAAIAALRESTDTRWHAVADLLAGGPLGYAQLTEGRDDPARFAANYPDLQRALLVAHAYLGD
ncbi:hypothetical protein AB0F72_08655 [Actinoplanes sp. NPDC023936]|uniref:hypothetical protein n=1 Tax=Actinoplanes sp. NPDC023936 TaxID=3154910 RepID=UPI00340FF341